jgi:uncharacterized 2Fe-2S/4Fe-4S cluster protein (DUF4445 family)
MNDHTITFLPIERISRIGENETILKAAMRSGIHINASCGGNGVCGKCRVMIREGETRCDPHPAVSREEYDQGVRLACMTRSGTDLVVEIPLESQIDRAALGRKGLPSRILSPVDVDGLVTGWSVDPPVRKICVELPPPSSGDNVNDLARLTRELRREGFADTVSAGLPVLRKLAGVAREGGWRVTVTVEAACGTTTLLDVEPGDTAGRHHALAIDLGTTTVCGQLIDLGRRATGGDGQAGVRTLAEAADYNGQIGYGEDVISRIHYATKSGGLKRLQEAVAATVNGVIG